jgi:hypothetical protein
VGRSPAQQEGDRGTARDVPFQRFPDGAAHSGYAPLVQQTEQLRNLAGGRFSLGEGPLQQVFAFRNGQWQAARVRKRMKPDRRTFGASTA